ncbi:Short-chain dehydrogenase [Halopseudomonas xinjiangensis]|uniref:Short-chain dehydrogenase n=1 Tax=Halopseudomonas xinjiangensis TaxID=487184 RepID=A0A1H1LAX1_9GAMM|nr:SDR family NAD(P)-dependent oxidoreductase [Halopseudomonas xinjiangensis]SDR71741.1 Short-chain dehydrogenase [Halopseudomonas xinjiangensis]
MTGFPVAPRKQPGFLWFATAFVLAMLLTAGYARAQDNPFRDKVAVITGTSYGLGRELALLAAKNDMKLVLVDMRPEPSQQLAEQIRSQGGEAVFVEADLAKPEQRPQVIDEAMKAYGRIDYLFNNAGYSYLATLEQMDLDQAHHLFEVNYWAYADLAQRVIPIMREQGGGTILNVSSILGMRAAPPRMAHYSASKYAIHGLFQAAAEGLKEDNIKVYIAAPGGMRTHISKHSVGPEVSEGDRAADWEDPAVPARDIFEMIQQDEVVFNPGYIGR